MMREDDISHAGLPEGAFLAFIPSSVWQDLVYTGFLIHPQKPGDLGG